MMPESVSRIARKTDVEVEPAAVEKLVEGTNEFSLALFKQIEGSENLVISPVSASLALAMIYAGAEGETEAQMAKVLKYSVPQADLPPVFNVLERRLTGSSSATFELNIANAMWGQEGADFKEPFVNTLGRHYGSGLFRVDFKQPKEAAEAINGWADRETNGRIIDLVKPLDVDNAALVLTNAIYFDAKWSVPFEKRFTQDRPFTNGDGEEVSVPTMNNALEATYAKIAGTSVIALPYRGGKAEMLFIHPTDLASFESKKFTNTFLGSAAKKMKNERVSLSVPKFTFESTHAVNQPLESMGMKQAFTTAAEFRGVSELPIAISTVIQKAMIEVDEEGTVAAAATAVVMTKIGAKPEPYIPVTIDSPFLYLIRDTETGLILFMGRVTHPK
jgi:serpin B